MPFGAIFGSLFFFVLALWLTAGADHAAVAPRLFLALTALSLGVGLLLRRNWARWIGIGLSAAVAVLMLQWIAVAPGVAPLVFLMGAVASGGLLLVPATGSPGRGSPRPAPVVGHSVLALTTIGVLGFVGSLSLLGVGSAGSAAADAASVRSASGQAYSRVVWNDFGTGVEQAVAEDRPMLVVFVTSWCGYCKKMDRSTFKDPAVIDLLSRLVAVRVDTEETQERNGFRGVDLASRFGVRGTPTVALVGPGGELIARQSGYLDSATFLDWVNRALPERARNSSDVIPISTP